MSYKLLRTTKPGYTVIDNREYQPDRCNDGGGYSFQLRFKPQIVGWKVIFSTSADFPYCRKNGWFANCSTCAYNSEMGYDQVACVSTYRRTDKPAVFAAEWLGYTPSGPIPDKVRVEVLS